VNRPELTPPVTPATLTPQRVTCPQCRRKVFYGDVVRNRIIKVMSSGQAAAKCQCMHWVMLPLYFCQQVDPQQKT